jgi:ribosomal protein L44E
VPLVELRLICVECGKLSGARADGWRAYLTSGEDEPARAVIYCPTCARRELGDW